jgi:AbrB family looped-hinge helix DNA binding protein
MSQALPNTNKEEWLKVLGKGMITLPKKWRTEMGIENGDVVKAKKEGNKVIIEGKPQAPPPAPYRVYSAEEINEFLDADRLPDELERKAKEALARKPFT